MYERSGESSADAGALRRIALLLEYDGGAFAGSQYQENARSVQGVLEAAILKTTGETVRAAFAGRTDTGVHARGQVASFVTATALETDVVRRALNARLPDDVAVRATADVSLDFDPRHDARQRHYRYTIENGGTRPVLGRDRSWYLYRPLNVEAMNEAAQAMIGTHDFSAFASPVEDPESSTVRQLFGYSVSRRGPAVHVDVVANAFLRHQVRRMTGALVRVGKSRLTSDEYVGLLNGPAASAGPIAPARGLCLMAVDYGQSVFPGIAKAFMRSEAEHPERFAPGQSELEPEHYFC